MANTAAAIEHPLSGAHLASCLALSQAAHWNQNQADWTMMLEAGRGWGITLEDGSLAASTLVLPYGSFAWISMVLVHPQARRKGYATRLLRRALEDLKARGLTPVLDATPDGREVYRQEGFREAWGFRRYASRAAQGSEASAPEGLRIRPLTERDWPRVLALDAPAFGAGREALLRSLAARLPDAALVAENAQGLCGYLLGRDGRDARQLGPLVARDATAAKALFADGLRRVTAPVFVDLVDREQGLQAWLEACGFEFQRPFTRMVHGADRAPGDRSMVMLVAGPELG